ncbi:hypothetical protein D3C71_1528650 [compost metagenome]
MVHQQVAHPVVVRVGPQGHRLVLGGRRAVDLADDLDGPVQVGADLALDEPVERLALGVRDHQPLAVDPVEELGALGGPLHLAARDVGQLGVEQLDLLVLEPEGRAGHLDVAVEAAEVHPLVHLPDAQLLVGEVRQGVGEGVLGLDVPVAVEEVALVLGAALVPQDDPVRVDPLLPQPEALGLERLAGLGDLPHDLVALHVLLDLEAEGLHGPLERPGQAVVAGLRCRAPPR